MKTSHALILSVLLAIALAHDKPMLAILSLPIEVSKTYTTKEGGVFVPNQAVKFIESAGNRAVHLDYRLSKEEI